MATQKPISTISYNSESFLKEKLDLWVEKHFIQCYQYIKHKGEDGDKDHIHLRIEPNKKLDPMDLTYELKEFVMGQKLPLGVRPWRPSKEEDWYLYVVHDKEYLALKYGGGEKGEKLPYQWTDIVASEGYDTEIAFVRAKAYLAHTSVNMATRIKNGESPLSLVMQGENVYTVNAIMRAVSTNDYRRLQEEYAMVSSQLQDLISAINDYGLVVLSDENGNPILSPAPDNFPDGDPDQKGGV